MNRTIVQLILILLLSLSLLCSCTDDKKDTDGNKTSISDTVSGESTESVGGSSADNEETTAGQGIELPKVPF